jgi:DNA-binding response OmpR family regulator
MKILIIEDEPEVASLLAEVLEGAGHSPTVAGTGPEGLDRLTAESPQAVLLDVRLPGPDGVTVLREIRERNPVLPVVILTGHASQEQVAEARQLGVTEILRKPWALTYLREAIAALDTSRPRRKAHS